MSAQEAAIPNNSSRVKKFVREVKAELKKVSWPNRQELVSYTGIVFVATILVAFMISGVDWFFSNLLHLIINK
ncbi:MAG: preprotein translocase subunit SecE [Pelosinus sp.]|nr:preprotein translocase subunit SecE [Pelosinus sp.]